jgi:hypothetical protein
LQPDLPDRPLTDTGMLTLDRCIWSQIAARAWFDLLGMVTFHLRLLLCNFAI